MTVSNNLKELRIEKGLTQKKLAEALSVTVSTLSHWECGYQEPSIKDIASICNFFNVSVDYLIGRADELGFATTPMGEGITVQERELLEEYRTLSPNLQKMVRDTIKTFSTSEENKRNKA